MTRQGGAARVRRRTSTFSQAGSNGRDPAKHRAPARRPPTADRRLKFVDVDPIKAIEDAECPLL
jgi:hypothetical protein